MSETLTLPSPSIDRNHPAASKWQREHEAFVKLLPQLIASHSGRFVVIHEGQVVDSGPDELALALRFFAQHGNTAAHIGLVSASPESVTRVPHYRALESG